jgi:post-segregation antitoxin (ccd killing protein)
MSDEMKNDENKSQLVGYVRLSKGGKAVNVTISKEMLEQAKTYTDKNGKIWVSATISKAALAALLIGDKEVTSLTNWL